MRGRRGQQKPGGRAHRPHFSVSNSRLRAGGAVGAGWGGEGAAASARGAAGVSRRLVGGVDAGARAGAPRPATNPTGGLALGVGVGGVGSALAVVGVGTTTSSVEVELGAGGSALTAGGSMSVPPGSVRSCCERAGAP